MKRVLILLVLSLLFAACGGSKKVAQTRTSPTLTTSASGATTAQSSPDVLQGEANAAATGDIPDNQVYVVFSDTQAGYSIKYPEGWAQQGTGNRVTFRDKNNIVRVIVGAAAIPTNASVRADVGRLNGVQVRTAPHATTIAGKPAFKVVYSTESAPNSVTGKRLRLVVDRYYLWHAGRRAVVDLGTPEGVDNVDAYRLMIESFRWS